MAIKIKMTCSNCGEVYFSRILHPKVACIEQEMFHIGMDMLKIDLCKHCVGKLSKILDAYKVHKEDYAGKLGD